MALVHEPLASKRQTELAHLPALKYAACCGLHEHGLVENCPFA